MSDQQHGPGAFPRAAGDGFYNRGLWVPEYQVAPDFRVVRPPPGRSSFGVGMVGTPSPVLSGGGAERVSAVPDFPQRSPVGGLRSDYSDSASPPSVLQEYAELQARVHAMESERASMQWQLADREAVIDRQAAERAQLVADRDRMLGEHKCALLEAEVATLRASIAAGGAAGSVLRVVTTTDRGATVANAIESGVTPEFVATRRIDNQPSLAMLDQILQDIIGPAAQQPGVYDYYRCIAELCGLPSQLSAAAVDPTGSYALALEEVTRLSPVSVEMGVGAMAADVDDAASVNGGGSDRSVSARRPRSIFDAAGLLMYRRLVAFLGVQGVGRVATEIWYQVDLACLCALRKLLVPGSLAYEARFRHRTFLELYHSLLLMISHSAGNEYEVLCQRLIGPVAVPLVAAETTYALFLQVFLADIQSREMALRKLALHPWRFALYCATNYMPVLTGAKGQYVDRAMCKIRMLGDSLDESGLQEIVEEELQKCTAFDPEGSLMPNVAVALKPKVYPGAAPAAAGVPDAESGGSRRFGKRPGAQAVSGAGAGSSAGGTVGAGTAGSGASASAAQASSSSGGGGADAQPPPPGYTRCSAGPKCAAVGTKFGCQYWHTGEELDQRRKQLGPAYVKPNIARENRKRLVAQAVRAEAQAAVAPVSAAVVPQVSPASMPAPLPDPLPAAVPQAQTMQAMLHSIAHRPSSGGVSSHSAAPQGAAVPDFGHSFGAVSSGLVARSEPTAAVQAVLSPEVERELSMLSPEAVVNVRSFLEQHSRWYCGVRPALEAWCGWSAAEQAAYRAAHGGRDVETVLNDEVVEWDRLLGQLREALLNRGVSPDVAASVTAETESIIIWDSGSKKSFSDCTGLPLRECPGEVSVTAAGQRMVTNTMATTHFNVCVQRASGPVYYRVLDDSRHVEGLRTSAVKFRIVAPYKAYKAGAESAQRGLDGGYLRLPYRVPGEPGVRFTAKIPLCWPPGLEICVIPTVPDSAVPEGQVIIVNMADYESMGPSVGSVACAAPTVGRPTVSVSQAASASSPFPAGVASTSGSAMAESLCLVACAPTALEAAPSISGDDEIIVARIDAAVAGAAQLSVAVPATAADLRAVRDIDAATDAYQWAEGFSAAAGVLDGSTVRSTILAAGGNRFAPAADLPDEEYVRRSSGSESDSRLPGAMGPKRRRYRRASRRKSRAATSSVAASSPAETPEPEEPPVEFVLCACTRASAGHGCTGVCAPGSPYCPACLDCAGGGCSCTCCGSAAPHADVADALPEVVVSGPCWIWDHCAGGLAYTITRLRQHPGLCSFAADIFPPHVALARIAEHHPDLLSRIVYVQVPADHIPTFAWLDAAMHLHCGVSAAYLIEGGVGPPCNTVTTRSGRRPPRNPHRAWWSGRWYPITWAGAWADRFRQGLFSTLLRLRRGNPYFGFLFENPASALLWEFSDVQEFIRASGAHTAVIDHCVVGLSPADLEVGVPQKPSRWVFNPGLGAELPDLRCSDYPCVHRLEHSPAHHRWVIQRPAKGSPGFQAGQQHVLSADASRVPEGLYAILDLSRWCSPAQLAHLAAPAEPVARSIAAVGVSAASPVLPRFTAENCVYSADTLHEVFGHNVTGERLRDTVNGCVGFRMRRSDGTVVRAPHVTTADVALSKHCAVCACTQMRDAGSRHDRRRPGAAASALSAAMPAVPFVAHVRP